MAPPSQGYAGIKSLSMLCSVSPFVVLDACVLMSTVQRQLLLRLAGQGVFQPVWTDRIGEEWRRNAARLWQIPP